MTTPKKFPHLRTFSLATLLIYISSAVSSPRDNLGGATWSTECPFQGELDLTQERMGVLAITSNQIYVRVHLDRLDKEGHVLEFPSPDFYDSKPVKMARCVGSR
jgi:hypothetical protein